jgi:NAD(P)H-flavin reductase
MKTGQVEIKEIYLDSSARIVAPTELIPAPGQYLLADLPAANSPAAIPIFPSESTSDGFRSAPALPSTWTPGTRLTARGPLGHGFSIPAPARRIALLAFDDSPARLRGLIPLAFKQNAEVVLVCNSVVNDLPESVEVQPLQALTEILNWADFVAADIARENWTQFKESMKKNVNIPPEAQVLIRAPMPCGALAECGVCALTIDYHWKMICKEGPVFKMGELG